MFSHARAVVVPGAILVLAGCTAQPRTVVSGAGSGVTAEAAPVGAYALTDSLALVIETVRSDEGGAGNAWALRVGEDSAHAMVRDAEGGWSVPGLGIELVADEREGVEGLTVRRYGESVFVAPVSASAGSAPRPSMTPAALAELTPRLMIGLNVPGVGIALVRDGAIAWRGSFGVKRAGGDARVDSLTVFEAASMSKPAYTYPFMTLVQDGTIDLDTPLVRYLGRDYLDGDTLHRAITARMALSHTTGFPNWRGDDALTVEFEPGTQVGYSGEGFQYLQTVVEQVTGQPMDEFARERLFDPLALATASYVWLDAYDSIAAFGHTADGVPNPREPYTEPNAAYTLYITPADYARILIEIMRPDRSATHSLDEATRALMLASQHMVPDREPIPRGGQDAGEVHFALGWRFDRSQSGDRYWHSGSNSTGFKCYAEFDPETGDGIVIMTNSSSGGALWSELMDATGRP